jgi:hypothetical protein
VTKTKTKMVKYHFSFAHFVVVLILILPLNGRNGAKGKFQIQFGKNQCAKNKIFRLERHLILWKKHTSSTTIRAD